MARLSAAWQHFWAKQKTYKHFWQDAAVAAPPPVTGTGDVAPSVWAISGAGQEVFPGAASEAPLTWAISGAGAEAFSGSGAEAPTAWAIGGSGAETFSGVGAESPVGPPAASGAGGQTFAGSGSVTAAAPAIDGVGAEALSGVGVVTAATPSIDGIGAQTFTGSAAVAGAPAAIQGGQAEPVSGTGDVAPAGWAVDGSGTVTAEQPPPPEPPGPSPTPFQWSTGGVYVKRHPLPIVEPQQVEGAGKAKSKPPAVSGTGTVIGVRLSELLRFSVEAIEEPSEPPPAPRVRVVLRGRGTLVGTVAEATGYGLCVNRVDGAGALASVGPAAEYGVGVIVAPEWVNEDEWLLGLDEGAVLFR